MSRGRKEKEIRNFREYIISAAEASNFLKVNERTFNRMVEAGKIPQESYGNYVFGDVYDAYVASIFDSKGLKEAQTRLVTAQAEIKENELAEQRGELHRSSAVAKVWTDNVINAKTRLLAIPNKLAPVLVGQDVKAIREKIEDEIKEALTELAEYDGEKITRTSIIQGN